MDWDVYETGPGEANHSVLLLPGGLTAARSCVPAGNCDHDSGHESPAAERKA